MLKTFLAGATALAIAGGAYAYAQQSSTVGAGGEFQRVRHARMGAEDVSAFGDARIAALHAGLKLTAEQEKLWPPVENALRDLARQRSERFAARGLKKLADAAGPLYKSLDDGQKRRFALLARLDRGQMRAHRGGHHHGPHGGMMDKDGGR